MRILLAGAAAVTERVRIVPSLYVLPMHSAVWAAKEIATLDQLSGGRVTVTVGVGGRESDYKAVGASFKNRHQRMDEQVAQMRRIWAGEAPFEDCDPVGPQPFQNGGPPILAGSMGPKSISRAAKWADGLYGFAMNGEKAITQYFKDSADQAWQDAGRNSKPYFVGGFWYSMAPNAKSELHKYVYNYMRTFGDEEARSIAGTMTRHNRDAIKAALDDMELLGVDELFLVPATADFAEIDAIADLISRR
jgi:alkanesulfonate monooxygenase SsuD/methylene tetrahydromethanopterin reductase-like flavin-dependent oxidoreductase (luciferase family)